MLKYLTVALFALAGFASPAHALPEAEAFAVRSLSADGLMLCHRQAEAHACYDLSALHISGPQSACTDDGIRHAITEQSGSADALPPQGLSNLADLIALVQSNGTESPVSGIMYICSSGADDIVTELSGAFCLDTILRDGVHEYDICARVRAIHTLTPALDAAASVNLNTDTEDLAFCTDDTATCVRLQPSSFDSAMCGIEEPRTSWQLFGRFASQARQLQLTVNMGQSEGLLFGQIGCDTPGHSSVCVALAEASEWAACTLAIRQEP